TVHEIDRFRSFGRARILPSAAEIEAQSGKRLVSRFEFGAFHMRVEIVVDGSGVDYAGNLIILVIVIEEIRVQRKRAVKQRVRRTQLERIHKFGLEGKRMDWISDIAASECQQRCTGRIGTARLVTM